MRFDYRYGFNGMEGDNEVKGTGNSYDFGARMYDSRVGRFLSLDPKQRKFPTMSPYVFAANNPIYLIDVNGESPGKPILPGIYNPGAGHLLAQNKFRDIEEIESTNPFNGNNVNSLKVGHTLNGRSKAVGIVSHGQIQTDNHVVDHGFDIATGGAFAVAEGTRTTSLNKVTENMVIEQVMDEMTVVILFEDNVKQVVNITTVYRREYIIDDDGNYMMTKYLPGEASVTSSSEKNISDDLKLKLNEAININASVKGKRLGIEIFGDSNDRDLVKEKVEQFNKSVDSFNDRTVKKIPMQNEK